MPGFEITNTIQPRLITTIFTETPLRGCKVDPFSNHSIISLTNNTFVSINLDTNKASVVEPTQFISEFEKITSPLSYNADCTEIYFFSQRDPNNEISNLAIFNVINKTITYSDWNTILYDEDTDYFG